MKKNNIVPLVADSIIDTRIISINIESSFNIETFETKFVSFGSCFAANVHKALSNIGFNSYYEVSGALQFNARNMLQLFQLWEKNNFQANITESDFLTISNNEEKEFISPYHCHAKDKDLEKLKK